jgi:drug/metabolite transporter (DMT)-like permease
VGTTLLGWWLLGEAITGIEALGGVAVLTGISLAARSRLTQRPAREDSPRTAPR